MPRRNKLRKPSTTNNVVEKKRNRSEINLKWDNNKEDENINSDEEYSSDEERKNRKKFKDDDEDDDEKEEISTEQQRKILAQKYLEAVQEEADEENEDLSDNEQAYQNISERLKRERLEKQGKYVREMATLFEELELEDMVRTTYSGHELPVTCVALSSDNSTIYSGSKDNSLLRYDIESSVKTYLKQKWRRSTHGDHQSSEGEILAVAVSTDGKYVASGGRDKIVRIYDSRINSEIKSLPGHRDAVTSLAFRRDSPSLFSGSLDRCIKHWDMNEMGYLETLFGHQDGINSLDCWVKPRPLSSSSDRSIRLWNVQDETHLVFRGHKSSVDCAQYLTLDTYVSSGEDGSICLWKETQKRPISIVHTAHGMNGPVPHWISAMSSLKISDLFATGSSDGYLNFWTGRDEKDSLSLVKKWHIGPGFINGIALSSKFVILGIGSEHRLGRWERIKSVRNRVEIIKLPEEISGNAVNDDSPLDDNDSSGIDSDDASDSNSGGDSESEA